MYESRIEAIAVCIDRGIHVGELGQGQLIAGDQTPTYGPLRSQRAADSVPSWLAAADRARAAASDILLPGNSSTSSRVSSILLVGPLAKRAIRASDDEDDIKSSYRV